MKGKKKYVAFVLLAVVAVYAIFNLEHFPIASNMIAAHRASRYVREIHPTWVLQKQHPDRSRQISWYAVYNLVSGSFHRYYADEEGQETELTVKSSGDIYDPQREEAFLEMSGAYEAVKDLDFTNRWGMPRCSWSYDNPNEADVSFRLDMGDSERFPFSEDESERKHTMIEALLICMDALEEKAPAFTQELSRVTVSYNYASQTHEQTHYWLKCDYTTDRAALEAALEATELEIVK